MSDELVFYTNPMSRGRIVRWMLEEVGQPYRTELLDYATTMKAPEYLAINPMGKVPALRHGDTVVTEARRSAPIWPTRFPRPAWRRRPVDRLRGPYYRWLFFAAGPLEAAWTNQALGFAVPPERERMAGYGSFAAVIDVLEGAVSTWPVSGGRQLHRRRRLCRLAARLRPAVRHDREAARRSWTTSAASAHARPRCARRRSTTRSHRRHRLLHSLEPTGAMGIAAAQPILLNPSYRSDPAALRRRMG